MLDEEADPVEAAIARLNARYAVVVEGGDVGILESVADPAVGRLVRQRLTVQALRTLYRNQTIPVGKRRVSVADLWLDAPARLTYERVLFDPSPDYIATPETLNLWQGFAVPAAPAPYPRLKEHFHEIGAAGDDDVYAFLMQWFAWLVQSPHRLPGTAIVWQGGQGVGKGSLVAVFQRMLGQHFVHVSHVRHLVGHFNAHLADALLVFADEAMWAGDKASEGALKTLITESALLLERKGHDPIMMPNRAHVVMATNHEWAAPMDFDDRRFCVIETPGTRRGQTAYFAALHHEIANGGASGLLWDLHHTFVDGPPRPPGRSDVLDAAALKQKVHSMQPVERWWYSRLEAGQVPKRAQGWPDEISKSDLHDDYLADMERVKASRRSSETEFAMAIRRMVPEIGSVQRRTGLEARERYWQLPVLEACRDAFAFLLRLPRLFDHADDTHPL